jgi:hypothetical protein
VPRVCVCVCVSDTAAIDSAGVHVMSGWRGRGCATAWFLRDSYATARCLSYFCTHHLFRSWRARGGVCFMYGWVWSVVVITWRG